MQIVEVRARTVRYPLERPIRTADLVIDAREFVVVDVVTDDGTTGRGYGFTRGGLVAASIDRHLAPLLVGTDPHLVEDAADRMTVATRYLGRRGLMVRAISATEIALWDLKAKSMGAPVWALLGGARRTVDVHVAGGYYRDDDGLDDLAAEFARYRDAGYAGAKMNVGGLPLDDDLRRVAAARRGFGDGPLAVDVNGAFRDARTALRWAEALRDEGVSTIEEPFLMDDVTSWHGFRTRSPLAVSMGEDESGLSAFRALIEGDAMDVVRADATLAGGIGTAVRVAALASARGLRTFPHWFPEVHRHLACALPGVLGVEVVDARSGVMDVHRIISQPAVGTGGVLHAPDDPGLGIAWDEEAIERWTV